MAGNPLDWVLTDLEQRAALQQHGGRTRHDALRRLAELFRRRYVTVSRQRCLVHHMFTTWHVLVSEGRLLVIDFASSREGYAPEDLGLFLALDDVRAPWRRWLGRLRLSPRARTQAFLDGCQSVVGPLRDFDRVVLRFARVLAAARYTASAYRRRESWSRAMKARCGAPWLGLRLRDPCNRELATLRELASEPEEPGEAP